MAGIAGSHADSLAAPVPNVAEAQAAIPQPTEMPAPQGTPAPQAAEPDYESLYKQATQGQGQQVAAVGEPDYAAIYKQASAGQAPQPEEANPNLSVQGLKDQAANVSAKFRASFAETPFEKQKVLEQSYGADNVKKMGSKFMVKRDGKWSAFDSDQFKVLEDLAGQGKNIFSGVVGGATAAGVAGASVAGAPETLGATLPGLALAGGIGAGAGQAASHEYAQYLGVPQDPEKSTFMQTTKASALGAIASGAIGAVEGYFAKRAGEKATTALSNSPAAQETRMSLDPSKEADLATRDALEVDQAAQRLHDSGLMRDGHMILPNEKYPNSPELQQLADTGSAGQQMRDFKAQRANVIADAVDKFGKSVGGNAADSQAPQILNRLATTDKAYGQFIGKYRADVLAADKELADKGIMAPKLVQVVNEQASRIGLTDATVPSATEVQDMLKLKDEATARQYIKDLQGVRTAIANSVDQRIPATQIDKFYNDFKTTTNPLFKQAGRGENNQAAVAYRALTDASRDDFAAGGAELLGSAKKDAYLGDMARYKEVLSAKETLGTLLKPDSMSNDALADHVLAKGAKQLDRFNAIRNIVEPEDPRAFQNFQQALWKRILTTSEPTSAATAQRIGGVNWSKVSSGIRSGQYSPEFLDAAFGKGASQQLQDLTTVGRMIQGKDADYLIKAPGIVARGISAAANLVKADPKSAWIAFQSPDQATAKMLANGGREAVLKYIKGPERAAADELIQEIISQAQGRAARAGAVAPAGLNLNQER